MAGLLGKRRWKNSYMASTSKTLPARPPDRHPSELARAGAEFAGTFFLTLVAAGADIIHYASQGEILQSSRYLAPGFVIAAMIWALSNTSGAHLNPAVTLAFVIRRTFPILRALYYWIAQFGGAIAAAGVLTLYFGDAIAQGATKPGLGITGWQAAGWEAILTLLLVMVIIGTADAEAVVGKNAALAVGLTVALCGLFSNPMTGASMNPARSFGPQLLGGMLNVSWIYFLGPLVGAVAACGVSYLLFGAPRESEHDAAHGKHA